MKVKLTSEEHSRLMELYQKARNTPMIAMTTQDALSGKDWATQAWDEVRAYMDELGKRYGYIPQTAQISPKSPEFEADPA